MLKLNIYQKIEAEGTEAEVKNPGPSKIPLSGDGPGFHGRVKDSRSITLSAFPFNPFLNHNPASRINSS